MKYFIVIVIGLVGLGVFLRSKNDASLKESTGNDEIVEVAPYKNVRRYPAAKKHNFNQPIVPSQQSGTMVEENHNSQSNATTDSDLSYNESLEATCPYTDASGFCSSEPLNTSAENEVQEDHFQASVQEPSEVLMIPDDNDYERYMNEQTFDSLRTPASEE